MKAETGPAARYITSIAITTAAIMISMSLRQPIAVMMESSEKTRSITTSCATTKAKARLPAGLRLLVSRLDLGVNFVRALGDQEQPAADQDQVAPGEFVAEQREDRRRQPHDPGQRQQQRDAEDEGERQADLARELAPARVGSRDDQDAEMKTMLSMPSTISSTVSVTSAAQALRIGQQIEHRSAPL